MERLNYEKWQHCCEDLRVDMRIILKWVILSVDVLFIYAGTMLKYSRMCLSMKYCKS
jgi:hypothetical protein